MASAVVCAAIVVSAARCMAGDGSEPAVQPVPHYTLQELRGAFTPAAAMGEGFKSETVGWKFPLCFDKLSKFPGTAKTAAHTISGDIRGTTPDPRRREWAAEYPDAASARRAFETLDRGVSCPPTQSVPRIERDEGGFTPPSEHRWRREGGTVSGWTQLRTITRVDYGRVGKAAMTTFRVQDFLLRGNAVLVIEISHFTTKPGDDSETVVIGTATRQVERLLSRVPEDRTLGPG
ncbi:hypothetical protein [Actinomadura sp. 3N407]|uniref:hypothetical protein n=1 Tax=Actinomadura sp. 3N407 TaxID=3457423 RepID=UPI003FCC9BA5